MSKKLILLVLVLVLVLCAMYASAEEETTTTQQTQTTTISTETDDEDDDEDEEDEFTNIPPTDTTTGDSSDSTRLDLEDSFSGLISSPDCEPSFVFPDVQENKVPIGKVSDILLGFKNTGDRKFNVQYIRGYLVSPMDWNYVVQNFTGYMYNVTVLPDQSSTFLYKFKPDPRLEPRDFGVVVEVFYLNEQNDTFATTFFNQTVSLVEVEQGFDIQYVFTVITLLVIIALGAFAVYQKLDMGKTDSKKSKTTTTPTAVASSASPSSPTTVDRSWLPADVIALENRKKKGSNKGGVKSDRE